MKIYDDIWTDMKEGDDYARVAHQISAMGRPLRGKSDEEANVAVALWYLHGQPVGT